MSKKRSSELDALLDEILADAHGDEEQLWALRQALEDNVKLPYAATIAGEPVKVTKFDYEGNARRGLTATIRRPDGSKHVVAAADIHLEDAPGHRYICGISAMDGCRTTDFRITACQEVRKDRASGWQHRCRRPIALSAGRTVQDLEHQRGDHASRWQALAGCARRDCDDQTAKQWTYGGKPYLSGNIEATRLDAKAIGLTPLRLEPFGDWDPAEEYWGEPGDPVESWAKKIIKHGRRPQFEMEQVIPGEDPDDCSDPVIESNEKKDSGDFSSAYDILMGLCRADLRCLDAHAHLGNLSFDTRPNWRIVTASGLQRRSAWGMIDNRPFLRCLNGYGLCLWRLERFDESLAVCKRMLWLNPSDNQGVRFVIDDVRKRRAWRPDD